MHQDLDLPPIMEEDVDLPPIMEEEEIESAPVNEERAIVLYKPIQHYQPHLFVDGNLISGFKSKLFKTKLSLPFDQTSQLLVAD